MRERCRMLRQPMLTSSPLAGRAAGTPCTTSCRVPQTLRDGSCPSPCLCPSCASMQEEMKKTRRTATALQPWPSGRRSRETAKLRRSPSSTRRAAGRITASVTPNLFFENGVVAGV